MVNVTPHITFIWRYLLDYGKLPRFRWSVEWLAEPALYTAGPGHGGAQRHDGSARLLDHKL
jgi:hypothetical protein